MPASTHNATQFKKRYPGPKLTERAIGFVVVRGGREMGLGHCLSSKMFSEGSYVSNNEVRPDTGKPRTAKYRILLCIIGTFFGGPKCVRGNQAVHYTRWY